jgi:hypothetical protein
MGIYKSKYTGPEIDSLLGEMDNNEFVHSATVDRLVVLTSEEYDALEVKDNRTLYIIKEGDDG